MIAGGGEGGANEVNLRRVLRPSRGEAWGGQSRQGTWEMCVDIGVKVVEGNAGPVSVRQGCVGIFPVPRGEAHGAVSEISSVITPPVCASCAGPRVPYGRGQPLTIPRRPRRGPPFCASCAGGRAREGRGEPATLTRRPPWATVMYAAHGAASRARNQAARCKGAGTAAGRLPAEWKCRGRGGPC